MSVCPVLVELEGAGGWGSDDLWQPRDTWDAFFAEQQFPSCYLNASSQQLWGLLAPCSEGEMRAQRCQLTPDHSAQQLLGGRQAEGVYF